MITVRFLQIGIAVLLGIFVATWVGAWTQDAVPLFACADLAPPLGATPQSLTRIFLTAPGGGFKFFLTGPGGDALPAWFPDFQTIVFSSLRAGTGTWELYAMRRDGSDLRAITAAPGVDKLVAAVSPDGTQVAYSCGKSICLVSADGTNPHVVIQNAEQPRWSPDGGSLIYTQIAASHLAIFIAEASGVNARQVTFPVPGFPDANAAAWSPRGDLIVFWSGIRGQSGQIFVAATDGSRRRQLSACAGFCTTDQPSFSPDGGTVLAGRGHQDGSTDTRVFNPYGPEGQDGQVVLPFLCADGRQPWGY